MEGHHYEEQHRHLLKQQNISTYMFTRRRSFDGICLRYTFFFFPRNSWPKASLGRLCSSLSNVIEAGKLQRQ